MDTPQNFIYFQMDIIYMKIEFVINVVIFVRRVHSNNLINVSMFEVASVRESDEFMFEKFLK